MNKRISALFLSVALSLLPVAADACGTGAVLFSDNFNPPDPGWGQNTETTKKGNGLIAIQAKPAKTAYTINATYIFADADICARAKTSGGSQSEDPAGGLVFWAASTESFYMFVISPNGNWQIQRYIGRWIPVNEGKSDGIKGIGIENEVEVRTAGNSGEAYVNGKQVASFNGQPPVGGGYVGVFGESAATHDNVWEFRDLRVLRPN